MNKEPKDSLEINLSRRKQFLFDNDLEKLQQEFISKKEKCNSKIINKKVKDKEKIEQNNLIIPSGEIKKKKGKKKIKDVISLNLPPLNNDNNEPSKIEAANNKEASLFSKNYKNEENTNINISTGLPETFKIEETNYNNEDMDIIKENKKENYINFDFNNKEYDDINNENNRKIEQMSKEEILEAQNEIFANIPSDLLEKFKSNFFSDQIKESLKENNILNNNNTSDNNINEIKEEKNTQKENDIINDINKNINLKIDSDINEEQKTDEQITLFSYEGKIKKENKEQYLLNNPENKETIDYRYLTFEQLDLKNKFFSLNEINSLLSSSNNLQISIGLHIILNLLENKYHLTLDIFISQLDSLLNKLYYMINSSNLNIKIEALKCIFIIYKDFFYQDYKIFKFNSVIMGSYPSIIYFGFNNMNSILMQQKKICIKSIQENGYENIIEYINMLKNDINGDINDILLNLIFYTIYICEKVPCKLNKIFEIKFDILSKKQKLLKLMAILCSFDELDKNKDFFDKYIKNKNFLKFIFEIRGMGSTSSAMILSKNISKSEKNKIYELNYLLIFNNNNSIKYDIYSKEKNFLLLSKILQLKLFFCLNTENNDENDNYLSLVNNGEELNFWVDKFRECIKIVSAKESNINYFELMSIYKYISIFLYLWSKAFKYPQLISYKKISFELNDILDLFPLFNNILINTLNKNIFNSDQISFDKNDTIRNLYPYSILLEMNLNYLKCFIKNYDIKTNINGLSLYFIKLSELINKGDEYYYRKYSKLLKTLLNKKLSFSKINNINKYFNYTEIEEDLNFYLYSNDDLRKSTFYKRIFSLIHNNERLHNINLILSENNKIFDSKYFPFDSNFIFQIISNEKAKISIKINYLLILIILYENENIQNILNNPYNSENVITPFEIMIKFLSTMKLSEFNSNKKLYEIFKIFVKFNLIKGNLDDINLSKNDNNKIIMGNFFELYDSNIFLDENKILIEIIPLLFIFLHNNKKNENNKLLEPYKYKKTIEALVYDNFNFLSQFNNYFDFDNEEKNKIINFLMHNISIMFSSFYQTLILCYLNNIKNFGNNIHNLICQYAQKLCDAFGIKNDEYKNYVEKEGLLMDIIQKSIKKIKNKNQ